MYVCTYICIYVYYYTASASSAKMGRSNWLRRSDWQSLVALNGPVHYRNFKFAGLHQQIYIACFCQRLRIFCVFIYFTASSHRGKDLTQS